MDLNYVKVYEDVLPYYVCDQLIDLFDNSVKQTRDTTLMKFKEVNLNELVGNDSQLIQKLVNVERNLIRTYIQDCSLLPYQFPANWSYEQFRIKRYSPFGYFRDHVDVGDANSSVRFLSFLYYLNTPEGGETVFYNSQGEIEHSISPKQGSVMMFPPTWLYPHAGLPPITEKYIMSSYCHYLPGADYATV